MSNTEHQKLVTDGYNSNDCETYYHCPECKREYSYWQLFHKEIKPNEKFYCDCGTMLYYQ